VLLYADKIIEPIQSRCAILRYTRLTDAQILKRLLEICEAEKVRFFLPTDCRLEYNQIPSTHFELSGAVAAEAEAADLDRIPNAQPHRATIIPPRVVKVSSLAYLSHIRYRKVTKDWRL